MAPKEAVAAGDWARVRRLAERQLTLELSDDARAWLVARHDHDLFSFTTNNHPWTAHEWLSQVTIYGAWKAGGYTGLMIWLCVFPSALFIAGYVLCSLYSGNAKVALLGALVTWFCSWPA